MYLLFIILYYYYNSNMFKINYIFILYLYFFSYQIYNYITLGFFAKSGHK